PGPAAERGCRRVRPLARAVPSARVWIGPARSRTTGVTTSEDAARARTDSDGAPAASATPRPPAGARGGLGRRPAPAGSPSSVTGAVLGPTTQLAERRTTGSTAVTPGR